MENFEFCVGTDILFGKGQLEKLPGAMAQYGKKVLLVYGGGSIKRTGLYDRVKNALKEFEIFDLGGVEPNPRVETVRKGAALCREKDRAGLLMPEMHKSDLFPSIIRSGSLPKKSFSIGPARDKRYYLECRRIK